MHLSLSARLALIFSLITVLSLSLAGVVLFNALTHQLLEQSDRTLQLKVRHLCQLARELDSTLAIRDHHERLVALALGDPELALRIETADGTVLIDHDPSHIGMIELPAAPACERAAAGAVQHWNAAGTVPVRGAASMANLRDGSGLKVSVARSMSDQAQLLNSYRNIIFATVASTTLIAVVLCYLFVRRALVPLRAIAASAQSITAERLDSRIDVSSAPLELHDLAKTLNAMLQRLQQGFDRLWQFTVDLAHDLRTPIGNMRGASEVALTRTRSATDYRALLASNIEECDRVTRMIENVLFLARAESPQFALHRSQFDAGEELQRIAEYFDGISAESGVQVRVSGRAQIYADRELFRRAVSNLLANALRYTPRDGSIYMVAAESARGASIRVQNPGDGIATADLGKVFDRFYRGDEARSNSGTSNGLGLAIVKTIVEIHGGTALARSEAGTTAFELHFPAFRDGTAAGSI
jgi:two-component system, OmpR family, heavy metal sensor histidine kinase CusS